MSMANQQSNLKLDVKSRRIMQRFLILPCFLGLLIVLTGTSGVYVLKYLTAQLNSLNHEVIETTGAFVNITNQLNIMSRSLLRMNEVRLSRTKKNEILEQTSQDLKKIELEVQRQVELSHGLPYEEYLKKWLVGWKTLNIKMSEKWITPEAIQQNIQEIDSAISDLIQKMSNINEFIQSDVQDRIDQATQFSSKAISFLWLVLFTGVGVGVLASIFILKILKSLLHALAEGKQNIEILINHLSEGFFMINSEGVVQDGVSRAAKDFIGKDPVDMRLIDVLPIKEVEKESLLEWQKLIFESQLPFSALQKLAPQFFLNSDKYIALDFKPIYSNDEYHRLEKVICITSDKTLEKKLELKAEDEASLVKMIMNFVSDRDSFVSFIREVKSNIQKIKNETDSSSASFDLIFRKVHTLKAELGAFGLKKISKNLHCFEAVLNDMKNDFSLKSDDYLLEIKRFIHEIEYQFDHYLNKIEFILGGYFEKSEAKREISISIINELASLLLENKNGNEKIHSVFFENFFQENFSNSFLRFKSMVNELGSRQHKKVNLIIEHSDIKVYLEPYQPLLASFSHVFRNSIDHGIETVSARIQSNKSEEGRIVLKFSLLHSVAQSPMIKILVEDDGRGVDLDLLKNKLIQNNWVNAETQTKLTDQEWYLYLFQDGFSTLSDVTEISGRGVGLSSVRHEVEILGGRIWLDSVAGKGVQLHIEVPLTLFPVNPNLLHDKKITDGAA